MQRKSELADWNGRTVLIDDGCVETVETTPEIWKMTISTKAVAGDKIKINNVELIAGTDFLLTTDSAAGNAAAIAEALNASTDASVSCFTWSNASGVLKATEDTGYYGQTSKFTATVTNTTDGTLAVSTVTSDQSAVVSTVYTTYILGRGAIDYCDCGAKVPSEVYRDPKSAGGYEELITRQRKLFAPAGFSFLNTSLISPTDAQFATSTNWDLAVSSGGLYYPTKAIPIARIKSLGY